MPLSIDKVMAFTRKQWRYLLQFGAWIMLILGSFVLPPPLWDFKEDSVWFHFTHFVVSVLLGLVFLPMALWSSRKDQWRWWMLALILLVSGISLFFVYQSLRGQWTVPYNASRIVVGSTYTSDAIAYKEQIRTEEHREISDEDLVMNYVGRTGDIWNDAEIRQRRLLLAGIYMTVISVFALTMVTLVQALYCSTTRRVRRTVTV